MSSPLLDLDTLHQLREEVGDEGARAFVRTYLALLPGRADSVRRAVDSGSCDRLWEVAASLAVTSSMVGAVALALRCRQLQDLARGPGGALAAAAVVVGLNEVVAGTARALEAVIADGRDQPSSVPSAATHPEADTADRADPPACAVPQLATEVGHVHVDQMHIVGPFGVPDLPEQGFPGPDPSGMGDQRG